MHTLDARRTMGLLAILGLFTGCTGDDEGTGDGTTAAADDDGEGSSGGDPTTGLPPADDDGDTSGAADESSSGSADDATTTAGSDDASTTGEPEEGQWGALVIGTLAESDLEAAQAMHDAVAMGGQRPARALGDIGHAVVLGTSMLGTQMDEFVAIDRWTNLEGALTLYGDPDFGSAMSMLFTRPPSLELFEKRDDWYGWGDLDAGEGAERWFVIVRGTLADPNLDAAQQAHDMLAIAGEADATALGDVAHVVWLGSDARGTEAPAEFFAVDVWTDDANIEAFYGNPDFQAAFGSLFAEPPRVGVYRSTDWYQW